MPRFGYGCANPSCNSTLPASRPSRSTTSTRARPYGKRRPNGKGWIAKPGEPDRKFNVTLWASTFINKDGVELLAYNGPVEPFARTDRGQDKMRAGANIGKGPKVEVNGVELEPGRMVLFEAVHAEGNIADNGKRRADLYGYWNDNGIIVDIGAWSNDFEDGRVSAVGSTQPHYEKPLEMEASPEEIDSLQRDAEPAEEPTFDREDQFARA